ncbi:polyphenol oxidase family protein [Rhabdothermincola sp.]|uniref:polyphenol oxidase family protein n=1 Tax=Rhabdothermincola sp. TaxID=2820405 RepID=UPI002FE06C6C
MIELWRVPLPGGQVARASFTVRSDGDFAITRPAPELEARRRSVLDLPWAWVRQVHGSAVVAIDDPATAGQVCGAEADAVVTGASGIVASVTVADCAPVALVSPEGVVAAVHAGWRGLSRGVLRAAVDEMRARGAVTVNAYLGPCIHPECYEFGIDDLAGLVRTLGPGIRSLTGSGRPALDLPTAVAASLSRAGVALVGAADVCTACGGDRWFSHRARAESGRHALAVWMERRS